jgi:hypothetical protein
MKMKIQVVLLIMAALALAGCDHYKCTSGAQFDAEGCTSTGSGLSGGSPTSAVAYPFFIDTNGTIDGYTLTASTFGNTTGYTAPTIPASDIGLGMAVAQNQFLYAVFPSTQQLYGWSIDSAGNLTAITGLPVTLPLTVPTLLAYNEYAVITNPTGTLLFISNAGANNIFVFQIGTGGAVTAAPGSPFSTPGVTPMNLGMDGLGKYLYVTSEDASLDHLSTGIGAYSVSSTGVLAAVPGSPFTSNGSINYNMFEVQGEATGKYLIGSSGEVFYLTGVDDTHLYVFGIGTNGAITPVSGSPFATQFAPFNIAVQPNDQSGAFIYSFSLIDATQNPGPNPVEGYQLNPSTGALTAVAGSPFTGNDQSRASWGGFDPSGAYLFFDSEQTFVPYSVGSTGNITQLVPTGTTNAGYWAIADAQ